MGMSVDLERLRRKIARIDRRWQDAPAHPLPRPDSGVHLHRSSSPAQRIEELLSGEVLETPAGTCFRASRTYEFHRRHGNAEISSLAEMNGAPLGVAAPPARWAFLDTETTGLAGGTGTYCFLVGVGALEGRDFRVQQFLMRDYSEEPALLESLAVHLERFDVLVTYNGKSFDAPLLETRFRMARRRPAHERLAHLDVLHSARRLFRLRLASCRLTELEAAVLGFCREGDLPGEMIPYYYFDYLRTHEALKLVPIFHHNLMDIVTLACLTSLVLAAVGDPEAAPLAHPLDLYSLAAWVARVGNRESAARLYQRALAARLPDARGLPEAIAWRAKAELAALHKRARDYQQALPLWTELSGAPNGWRLAALEELAKYYEHHARDYPRALELSRAGLAAAASTDATPWLRRTLRLQSKLARAPLFFNRGSVIA